MPTRDIKDSVRSSKTLAMATAEGERCFFRLTTYADDFGRFPADAAMVRAHCFTMMLDKVRENHVANWLMELAKLDLIRFYQGPDGKPYGFFPTWGKHQRTRAKHSKYPAPSSDDMCRQVSADAAVLHRVVPNNHRVTPGDTESAPAEAGLVRADGFDKFWAAYPRKKAKEDALRAWTKLAPNAELQAEILSAIAAQRAGEDWLRDGGRFIPYPASWLNGRRWTDDVRPAAPTVANPSLVSVGQRFIERHEGGQR